MVAASATRAQLGRWQTASFLIGAAGVAACVAGAVGSRQQFLQSYLFGYIFWFGLSMGCLALLMLHHVLGGAWGDLPRPMMEAGAMTLPWLAVLFIPILTGLPVLYAWAQPAAVAADPLLQHKQMYLNIPFVIIRAAVFFAVWIAMAWKLNQAADRQDAAAAESARSLSAPGLLLYMFTLSFALIDWLMSLEPHWYSTIYEVMVIIGFVLGAIALLICGLALFANASELSEAYPPKPFIDLGNMLLAFVMLWAYMGFSQYLIIWSANIPEEIIWYLRRQEHGWFWVAITLVAFQFFLPFLILLGRQNKRRLERLVRVAALVLAVHALETFWLIIPAFERPRFSVHWQDLATFVAIGGIWIGAWMGRLSRHPSPIGVYAGEAQE